MPKTKISEYSATANSNTDVASINIDEGCAPSGINNAIRAIMGHLKDFQSGTSNDPFTVGSSGSLTLSYGTANGVAYLNGSKVLTTGSALVFDGTNLGVGVSTPSSFGGKLVVKALTDGNFVVRSISDIGGSETGPAIDSLNDAVSAVTPLGFRATQYIWRYASSEAMRLTSTGLGIGTSSPGNKLTVKPSATSSGTLDVLTGSTNTDSVRISGGGTVNTWLEMRGYLGVKLYSDATNTVTVDSSGNLGLGVTPSAWFSSYKAMQISTNGSLTSNTDFFAISNNAYTDVSANDVYLAAGYAGRYRHVASSGQHQWYTAPSWNGTGSPTITFTQAMTLDASGNLLVGTTSALGKFTVEQNLGGVGDSVGIKDTGSAYGSGAVYISFRNNAGSVAGKIEHTASTTVNYNTSSDARLKRNIGIATDTSVIDQIVIHDFEWKEDSRVDRGVFAQEAHQIKSSAVSVGTDETNDDGVLLNPWGVDYSKFVPDIIVHAQQLKKTVQEQQAIIQSLTARITALEGA